MISPTSSQIVAAWHEDAWWLKLLIPVECLYRLLVWLRRHAYRSGLLPTYMAARPVVIVGNLTVGGSGKTPVVIALVEALAARGIRAGVVARGYRARRGVFPRTVDAHSAPVDVGDEAVLVFRRTGCPYVVAPRRAEAVQSLLDAHSIDIVISDDGLQHYALSRDMEIVLYDAHFGFGNGRCLPAGPLREPLQRLGSVDFVLARGNAADTMGVQYQSLALVNIESGEVRPPSPDSIGVNVYALSGIGLPDQFHSMLEDLGFSIRAIALGDHHSYQPRDFAGLQDRPVIMTEKDAVKCAAMAGPQAWYLKIDAFLPEHVVDAVAALAAG